MKEVECLEKEEVDRLTNLLDRMKNLSIGQKLEFLEQEFPLPSYLEQALQPIHFQEKLVLHSILAISQEELVFSNLTSLNDLEERFQRFVEDLYEVELFYGPIGGIIGYHTLVLRLLLSQAESSDMEMGTFLKPPGKDISSEDAETRRLIKKGIESLPHLCEIYPVGGAGDRLNLTDEKTKEPLPAATLTYRGRSLLEGLIRDLQAREYLYYKLYGDQVITPIALMTSVEKHNHEHILEICLRNHWFGRGANHFLLFQQPMVPMITVKGDWALRECLTPIYKPGGHGVIWKAAKDAGIFDKLYLKNRSIALIRQINNPIAGTDYGLMAFAGCGVDRQAKFGFASCQRRVNTAEGMDVLIEEKNKKGFAYRITNVEYTDFAKQGIRDEPEQTNSPYSIYPANTNILFANLSAVEKVLKEIPIPGMMVNAKSMVECLDDTGGLKEVHAARLESLMQNIADGLVDEFPKKLKKIDEADLQTFLTYNERLKTISVTKKLHKQGDPICETPEGAFYDEYLNAYQLLKEYCHFKLPPMTKEWEYSEQGPSFFCCYHPALGPLYSIIGQKMRNSTLKKGSELHLEIAELDIDQMSLEGSLIIEASHVMGTKKLQAGHYYNDLGGKCLLKNVSIQNKGIDYERSLPLWRGEYERKEALSIKIEGNGEFYAENVHFKGPFEIVVPEGYRLEAIQEDKALIFKKTKIEEPSWFWEYAFMEDDRIALTKVH